MSGAPLRVGVYVDAANLERNGGRGLRYDVLREFACRGGAEALRLNAYMTYDAERAAKDPEYRRGAQNFFANVREFGFKITRKDIRWYLDESGVRVGKANADLDLAVDAILQSGNLDRVLIASGDGDFVQVVRALQNKGCRVEIVACDNANGDLRQEADLFISGYLIPNLVPIRDLLPDAPPWGEVGSRVRGLCYRHSEKGYGFLRYIRSTEPDNLWLVDTRRDESPYGQVFFHDSHLTAVDSRYLPTRRIVLEFDLVQSDRGEGQLEARNIRPAGRAPA
ncbi:MAG: NYN domain-containing protein [Candidatus Krumholzibacteriia bacterium]